MTKFDKWVTHRLWIIAILIMLFAWFFIDDNKSIPVVILTIIISGLSIWALIAVGEPNNIKATIYWKDGHITYSGVFQNMSDYDDWVDYTYNNAGDLIDKIVPIYEEEE